MQVSEIMARALEFVAPDATVQAAAELMGDLDVSALPVGAPDDLQGIVTDRDILFRVVAQGRDNTRTRVREVMSSTVFTCREGDRLEDVMDMMAGYHVRRLPVLNEGGIVTGWITLSDISRRLLLETGAVRNALAELTAAPEGS
ncbi:MAG TPA: CBS domain-containing protein [Azospirillaceae bacterium]|nr:CBS domain-containing protein [Azospirillaceae bacterium]